MKKKDDPVQLLLFDFDGTLIDSKDDIATSVNATLETLGLPQRAPEEIFRFVGDGVKRLLLLSVGEDNLEQYDMALQIFRESYLSHCLDTTDLYPQIRQGLHALHGATKAIVTNKPREYTLRIVEGLGVSHLFAAIESPANGTELKPDPGMLLKVLDQLNIPPHQALMIGDSTNDIHAAKAAGVNICAVGYGYGNAEKVKALDPNFYCETPQELLQLLGHLSCS